MMWLVILLVIGCVGAFVLSLGLCRAASQADAMLKDDNDTVSDGFGSTWSATCMTCGNKSISVVRPGKVQCDICDGNQWKE